MTLREVRDTLGALLDRYILRVTMIALVAAFFVLVFADRIIVTVPAGHAAVLWKRFGGGTVVARVYGEGLRLIWPWDLMTLYDVRFQNIERDFAAVDSAGLRLDLKLSTRLRVNEQGLGHLHQNVGPNYVDVVIVPEIGAHTRSVIAKYTAEEVYAAKRIEIQSRILELVRKEISIGSRREGFAFDLIYVEDVLLRDIVLPPLVATAIEEKIRQFHMDQEWVFRLKREEKESLRKEIEAKGIRKFQDTVAPGISDQYLRWKGIDATLKLAESPNAKIVIIGSGPHGLPVILGSESVPPPGPPGASPRADVPIESQPARPAQEDAKGGGSPGRAGGPATERPPGAAATPTGKSPASRTPAGAGSEAKAAEPTAPQAAPPTPEPGGIRGFINRILGLGR